MAPDTVPRDTIADEGVTVAVPIPAEAMEQDTMPADTVLGTDSVVVVPPFPRWPDEAPGGWAFARWEWNRDQLLRYQGLSLLHLLERVPGLVSVRGGDFGSPTGVTALGLGGARVRVFVDGWEMDPLGFTTPDLQRLGLVDLESVRVERRLDGLRVELSTLRMPDDARPISVVEAGTGVYDTKLLRALLMRGVGRRSVVALAYEQATSAGFAFATPFTISGARLRWSYALAERTVLQLEYGSDAAESADPARPFDASERTLLLRGRSELRPGLMVDAMVGRRSRRAEEADPLDVGLSSAHAAVRASYELGVASLEGGLRLRSGAEAVALPGVEAVVRGVVRPVSRTRAEAELRSGRAHGVGGLQWLATARAQAVAGLSAFASLSGGTAPLGLVQDTVPDPPPPPLLPPERQLFPLFSAASTGTGAARLGGEWSGGGAALGAAAVALGAGKVAPFGFFTVDRGLSPVAVQEATGVEAFARLPVPLTGGLLRIEGDYTRWLARGGRPYLPEGHGRAALVAHGLFYDGQLEPTLRVEAEQRGRMLVPGAESAGFAASTSPYSLANLFLQIRILDVRAFLVFNNLTDVRTASDLPPQTLPGGRFYYGVHWIFRN